MLNVSFGTLVEKSKLKFKFVFHESLLEIDHFEDCNVYLIISDNQLFVNE